MSKSLHDSSFSFSRRFNEEILSFSEQSKEEEKKPSSSSSSTKLRTILTLLTRILPTPRRSRLGVRVVGTLFGYRRGHVYFALQEDPKQNPTLLIELSTPTSVLVGEMASGLVRMALECEKKTERKRTWKLLEEPLWRAYCNGKKCGYASRRECGAEEQKILKAVEPITMGAGVLPAAANGSDKELMYMRARFERVIGSKDSEAYYMMSPDCNGGPELSILSVNFISPVKLEFGSFSNNTPLG
ncbi:protein MIZU-KUSSEI 1-like [Cucurbita pepo subsp. pepo]|uniref:protein MIZU-KUSSEI 1-like n=1 Tax=Cucurbita pepo subsp. pepo TaxID=3664 RepID=UPI000C9D90BB|nr:protein MIZU-KUSSEI 1-like [Cucurbita pepo subsp. pepo]